jgi:hypothetical protein
VVGRGGEGLKIFIQPPHVWGSPEQVVRIAYKVLQNFEVRSARPCAIVGNQAVVLVAQSHVARALAVLERAGMRAVTDSAFRCNEVPSLRSVRWGKQDVVVQTGVNKRRHTVKGGVVREQMALPLSFSPSA